MRPKKWLIVSYALAAGALGFDWFSHGADGEVVPFAVIVGLQSLAVVAWVGAGVIIGRIALAMPEVVNGRSKRELLTWYLVAWILLPLLVGLGMVLAVMQTQSRVFG